MEPKLINFTNHIASEKIRSYALDKDIIVTECIKMEDGIIIKALGMYGIELTKETAPKVTRAFRNLIDQNYELYYDGQKLGTITREFNQGKYIVIFDPCQKP